MFEYPQFQEKILKTKSGKTVAANTSFYYSGIEKTAHLPKQIMLYSDEIFEAEKLH